VFSSRAACKANSANFTQRVKGCKPLSVFGNFLLIQKVTQGVGQNAPQDSAAGNAACTLFTQYKGASRPRNKTVDFVHTYAL
jgi:hypothetical protein